MSQSNSPHLFCFGLGYTGMALARRLMADGWRVSGTCRDQAQVEALSDTGVSALPFNSNAIEETLSKATHVLSTVPPSVDDDNDGDGDGDPVLHAFGAELGKLKQLSWIGYLSTTGVYGDTGGRSVSEDAPTAPTGPRGERRVRAEDNWLSLYGDSGAPVHIFRLPGIYGPGRCAIDQIRKGHSRRIEKPGHQFNRIHVDDIVQVLRASMAKLNPGATYNVADDEPAAPADVTAYACELMGIEPPASVPFEEARETMSEMALSFWRDNRRVSNRRIKNELSIELLYPTYREGLAAIWEMSESNV